MSRNFYWIIPLGMALRLLALLLLVLGPIDRVSARDLPSAAVNEKKFLCYQKLTHLLGGRWMRLRVVS